MKTQTPSEQVINEALAQGKEFVAPEIPDTVDTDSPVALVDAAIEAAETEANEGNVVSSEYSEGQLKRFRKLFQFPSIPNFGTDKAKAIPKLREWAKTQTEDGIAYVIQRCKSIVDWTFGLVTNPDEMSDCSSEDGKVKVAFKATLGMERTVTAALEALASESTKSIEKTWWSDTGKGFKTVVNGVGKLPDGQPASTVTSGQFVGKTVDTSGRLKRAIMHIVRCATHLKNGRDSSALEAYLKLTGNLATADGTPDFFFKASDVVGAVQARLFGLASRDAKDLAAQYEKDLKESKNAAVKTAQSESQSERDEEEAEALRKSLERQRNLPKPGQAPSQPQPIGKEFITWFISKDKHGNETSRTEQYRGIDGKAANLAKSKAPDGIEVEVETKFIYAQSATA